MLYFPAMANSLNISRISIGADDLGPGLWWAWIYCTWFTPTVFGSNAEQTGVAVFSDPSWLLSLATCAATLFAMPKLLEKRKFGSRQSIIAACLVAAGTLALGLSVEANEPAAYLAFGAIATGMGSGVLWALWGKRFEKRGRDMMALVPLSALVAAGCVMLAGAAALSFAAALPLGSCALLAKRKPPNKQSSAPLDEIVSLDKKKGRSVLIRLCAATLAACSVSSFAQATAYGTPNLGLLPSGAVFGMFLVFCASAPLFMRRPFNFVKPTRYLLFLEAIALALLIYGNYPALSVAYFLATAVSVCFDFLLVMYLVAFIEKGFFSSTLAFCLSEGFVQVGWLIGNSAGIAVSRNAYAYEHLNAAYLVLLCLLFLLLVFVVEQQGNAEKMAATTANESAVKTLAERYSLSKRETEICALLGQGRSIPFISDSLFLAKSTVETHVKHVYAKLDVHSRQELLSLLERARTTR